MVKKNANTEDIVKKYKEIIAKHLSKFGKKISPIGVTKLGYIVDINGVKWVVPPKTQVYNVDGKLIAIAVTENGDIISFNVKSEEVEKSSEEFILQVARPLKVITSVGV